MYPPLASPTSPQDAPMTDLNILNASVQEIQKPQKIIATDNDNDVNTNGNDDDDDDDTSHSIQGQEAKESDTLRNNIDLKMEMAKKRTSLNIENACPDAVNINDIVTTACIVSERTKFHTKRNSRALDNAMHGDNNNRMDDSSTSSSGDEKLIRNSATLSDVDNRKVRRVRSRAHNNGNGNGGGCGVLVNVRNVDNEEDDDYHDMENGNTSDSSRQRDSMTSKGSSSDDYFLCEKFKNSLNAQFTDTVQAELNAAGEPMDLLSPQEAELGRRYAEISQFKNSKW